jgi:hypothetical protein
MLAELVATYGHVTITKAKNILDFKKSLPNCPKIPNIDTYHHLILVGIFDSKFDSMSDAGEEYW